MDTTLSPEEALAWLRLALVPGVSPRMQRELLTRCGSPQSAADAMDRAPEPELVEATLHWLSVEGHSLVVLGDSDYPPRLLQTADPPCVLYVNGRRDLLRAECVAIVGSRNATPQGIRDAHAFAHALSDAGFCVVSGLALGIDAAAHRGGLAGASSTIAVMGTGPDRVYPRANHALARDIAATGCVITEFPIGIGAQVWNFPRRNRLISGLARGVLVVEAANQSGSLITARLAADQGRDVFAIPGSIHSSLSKGCHELIREGAKLVESVEDMLVELGGVRAPRVASAEAARDCEPVHPLLHQMGAAPISIDQLVARTGIEPASVCAQLTQLEIDGRIAALAGGWFQRVGACVIE